MWELLFRRLISDWFLPANALKLLIEAVDALIALKIHYGQLFDDFIFLIDWNVLKLIDLFVDMPQAAIHFGQL